jgi:hypothetical protein
LTHRGWGRATDGEQRRRPPWWSPTVGHKTTTIRFASPRQARLRPLHHRRSRRRCAFAHRNSSPASVSMACGPQLSA